MASKCGSSDASRAVRQSFSVVDGGKVRPVPRLLVVGVETFTRSERDALARAHKFGVRALRPQGLRAEDRAAWLAHCCGELGVEFRNMAVVAIDPEDVGMMLEAGVAYALETAGYDACVVADRVLPSRARGGLVQAIDAVCDLLG